MRHEHHVRRRDGHCSAAWPSYGGVRRDSRRSRALPGSTVTLASMTRRRRPTRPTGSVTGRLPRVAGVDRTMLCSGAQFAAQRASEVNGATRVLGRLPQQGRHPQRHHVHHGQHGVRPETTERQQRPGHQVKVLAVTCPQVCVRFPRTAGEPHIGNTTPHGGYPATCRRNAGSRRAKVVRPEGDRSLTCSADTRRPSAPTGHPTLLCDQALDHLTREGTKLREASACGVARSSVLFGQVPLQGVRRGDQGGDQGLEAVRVVAHTRQ
jgi:hypothetical protein